ncbi:MAG: peptide chain release factor N(5)-glutamine methyltransferase [Candidatus Omnitrophota bacterium]
MNEAELIFCEVLNCSRSFLYMNKGVRLDCQQASLISAALKRRLKGEPVQYILGKAEFMGLEFRVNKDVLIPRPETEILVEAALKELAVIPEQSLSVNVLEIGTGSGCIAVSLAKSRPGQNLKITATDISEKALRVARENAVLNRVDDKIEFMQGDLFPSSLSVNTPGAINKGQYALCVSNPPYIPDALIAGLPHEVRCEPSVALAAGRDGLDFYRRITSSIGPYLKEGGLLMLEMGYGQADCVTNIFKQARNFTVIELIKDYSGISRVIVAKKITA